MCRREIWRAHELMVAAALQIRETLTTIQWDAPRAIAADKVAAVRAALVAEQGKVPVAPDPYFFGKQVRAPRATGAELIFCGGREGGRRWIPVQFDCPT